MFAAALQAALAFNLACTGTVRGGPIGLALPEEGGAPFAVTYRIDIDGGRWCSDACEATEELSGVAAVEILLRDRHAPSGSHVIRILPTLARFTDTLIEGDNAVLRSGTCTVEPFTGLEKLNIDSGFNVGH